MSLRVVLVVVVAVALAAVGGEVLGNTRTAAQGPLYVSPGGSDRSSCSQRSPCQSFGHAYAKANPGQVVYVTSGTYPPQTITRSPRQESPGAQTSVIFEPAPGASVRVPVLSLGDSLTTPDGPTNLTIRNISGGSDSSHACGWQILTGSSDVTWDHVEACDFYVNGVTHVVIKNSSFGGCTQAVVDGPPCTYSTVDANPLNNDITLDGDTFHDDRIAPGATDVHMQCLFVGGALNLRILNSRFFNCDIFDIFLQYGSSVAPGRFDGLEVENNWFGPALTGDGAPRPTAVWFSARGYRFTNITVRSNSFSGSSLGFDGDGPDPTNFVVSENILLPTTCLPGVTFAANLWVGASGCDTDDVPKLPLGYRLEDGRLALVQPAVRAIRRVFTECARGVAPSVIAKTLAKSGLFGHVRRWRSEAIREIATNVAYLGGFAGAAGASPALTWQAQFNRAQASCGN